MGRKSFTPAAVYRYSLEPAMTPILNPVVARDALRRCQDDISAACKASGTQEGPSVNLGI